MNHSHRAQSTAATCVILNTGREQTPGVQAITGTASQEVREVLHL